LALRSRSSVAGEKLVIGGESGFDALIGAERSWGTFPYDMDSNGYYWTSNEEHSNTQSFL
jgi:hypothetical protein